MAAPRWASLDRSCDQYGMKLRADHGGSSPGGVLERAELTWARTGGGAGRPVCLRHDSKYAALVSSGVWKGKSKKNRAIVLASGTGRVEANVGGKARTTMDPAREGP